MLRHLYILFFFPVIAGEPTQIYAQNATVDSLHFLIKKNNTDTETVIHLNALCLKYKNTGIYDSALFCGNTALQLAKKLNYLKGIADSYNNIGNIYFNESNYSKAIENHFASLKIREQSGDKLNTAASYNNIGSIYAVQNKYEKAMEYFSAALLIYEELKDKKRMSVQLSNIGVIYFNQDNFSKALEYYFKALNMDEEFGNKIGVARNLGNIGLVYVKQNNYEQALENYNKSLNIFESVESKYDMAISYNNIGSIYRKLSQSGRALDYYGKALSLAKEIGSKEDIKEAYQNLSEIHEKNGDFKNAHRYLLLCSQIKDSIFNNESDRQITEMQIKYETEKKENEIKLLNNENEIKSLQISKQKQQLYNNRILSFSLLLGILLIVAVSWLFISRNRIKQKEILKTELLRQQELRTKIIIETQEQERKRIAQDLHDGIGQTLASLKINLSNKTEMSSEANQKIFEQTIKSIDDVYKEVRTLSHSMMPRALKESGLADAMDDLLDKTLKNSPIKYIFEKDNSIRADENIEIGLYRVFQELLNNILKHANASEIEVHLHNANKAIILMVEDNGTGINQNKNSHGIGLSNIEARVKALNGNFSIESVAEKGTIAVVRIPQSIIT